MTLTAEQSSNKAKYESAPTAEIIDIIRTAMGEGCIRPCHVYDAVDELICRIQTLENRTKRNCDIQWPRAQYWDKPWNPILGCKPCSPACDNCYAREAFTTRWKQSFDPHETTRINPPQKGVVFCGNATDLFGEWVDIPQIWSYFAKLFHFEKDGSPALNDATYLFCTKRVDKMCDALRNYTLMDNAYFGFTAENQEWFNRRFNTWRAEAKPGVNGWLSAEPLLGPIDLGLHYFAPEDMPFKWVATGCESGPRRRLCKLEWIESIVDQCRSANIPVFVKQLDIGGKCERDITKFPKHLQIRQVPWAKKGAIK